MSTLPTNPGTLAAQQPRSSGAAAAATSSSGMASIDPIKLLNKHKWLLVGAGIAGGIAGTGLNYALEELYPVWKPVAIFQCSPPMENMLSAGLQANETEMGRFMQTQVKILTSDEVLEKVVLDPALQASAPNWCAKFMRVNPASGEKAFNADRALRWLKDDLNARLIVSTTLIELSFTAKHKDDATAIVGLVSEKYMGKLSSQAQAQQDERTKSLRDTLTRIDTDVNALAQRRKRLIENDKLETVDERVSGNQQQLAQVQEELLRVSQEVIALSKAIEIRGAEIDNPAGFAYNNQIFEKVDRDPLVLDIKGRISRMDDELRSMLNAGKSREHREYKAMEARLAGARQNLEQERNRLMEQIFNSELEGFNNDLQGLQARKLGLEGERKTLSERQVALTQLQTEVNDIKSQIESSLEVRAKTNEDLQKIISLNQLTNANRVTVYQRERIPTELSFPQLKVMIPLGIIAGIGLIGGLAFLREIVDQRVKGPSDIALIPRMRLLGWVPDAAEDPEGKGAAETAFRDRPKGLVAESYRQLRSNVAKRIDEMGHKSILFMSGMPGSGATSVVANLALALAAADKKVLVIDANFRRPALHRVFGVQEAPGVADVLCAGKTLEAAVQKTSTPNVDVLSVGSRELRVVERLAAQANGELLARAKAAYDVILIDVAPAVVAGDGMALAQRVDATVMVVRAMSDKRGMVARIRNELGDARADFLGVVVNGVRASAGGYMKGNIRAAAEYSKA